MKSIKNINKKCAIFLGAKVLIGDVYEFPFEVDSQESFDEGGYNGTFMSAFWDVDDMKFTDDWNWIHLIITQIDLKKLLLPMNGIPDSIMPYVTARGKVVRALIRNQKQEVVKAIDEFIDWYNEHSK